MESHTRKSRLLKWSVIIGIVIVLNLFFNYALSLAYNHPEYTNYCPEKQVNTPPTTRSACIAIGGQWNETVYPPDKGVVTTPQPAAAVRGYCDPTFTCRQSFEAANKIYERNSFVALIILGVLSIILGLFLRTAETVTIGLSFGGVLSIIIASMRYWTYADNILKVVLLGVALVALIWVGVKKFKE